MFPEILKGFWRMAAYNQKESLNPVSKIYSEFEPGHDGFSILLVLIASGSGS
jgi:hypothetical protein